MTARSEDRDEDQHAQMWAPLLVMFAGFLAKLGFTVNSWIITPPSRDPRVAQTLSVYVMNLLLIAAIWVLSRRTLTRPRVIALSALLGMLALAGFSGADAIAKVLAASNVPWSGWTWQTRVIFALNLLIGAGAVWGFLSVRPWQVFKRTEEELSPATLRTQRLFGLAGLVSILAVVALAVGVRDADGNAVLSNSQNVSIGFAIVAIAVWLVAMILSWWWYRSADEHERRANDVGFLAGGGLFMAVTPIWWILWRAGVLPPPDAMIIWYVTMVAMGIGWAWYRNR
jgi:hypothetical protein